MSQCQGVNIYASGDCLVDERQSYLCTAIERLRIHMVTLKDKLEQEKMLLSELKAETQHLTLHQTDNNRVSEDYHSDFYQSESGISQISLSPRSNVAYAEVKNQIEESKQMLDRVEYMKRLREIDSLCKEEMTRMNSVVEQMEPLNQIASDWMLETRLKEMSGTRDPAREVGIAQPYYSTPGIEHTQPAYTEELIVVPPNRPTPPVPFFVSEGKCDMLPDSPVLQTPIIKTSKSKLDVKLTKEPRLKLDCLPKPTSKNNTVTATDKKGLLGKGKKKRKPKNSSSEVSLSSLEALKEKTITLIDVGDSNARKENDITVDKKFKGDCKSTGSGKTSKSAISLESIERAFANHHRKIRKAGNSDDTSDTEALSFFQTAHKSKRKLALDKNKSEEDLVKKDKLFAYLDPSAKKIVKNLVMIGREEKKAKGSNKRPERSKKCTLNLGRKKDAELSLCEDDVINKFLYDEDGYVYTPLFVSETENESSCDTSSVNEN